MRYIFTLFLLSFTLLSSSTLYAQRIIGIIADACGNEGNNEVWVIAVGDSDLDTSVDGNLCVDYNGATQSCDFVSDPNLVDLLNIYNDCGGTPMFIHPPDGIVPAGSKALVFTSVNGQEDAYDFTQLCGTGPYYVILDEGAGSGAVFPNRGNGNCNPSNPNNIQYITVVINGVTVTETWNCCYLVPQDGSSNYDGATVSFDNGGQVYFNDGCYVGAVLPISIVSLSHKLLFNNTEAEISFELKTQSPLKSVSLFSSVDGQSFEKSHIWNVSELLHPENGLFSYHASFHDQANAASMKYYYIELEYFRGEPEDSKVIVIDFEPEFTVWPNPSIDQPVNFYYNKSKVNKVIWVCASSGATTEATFSSDDNGNYTVMPPSLTPRGLYYLFVETDTEFLQEKLIVH